MDPSDLIINAAAATTIQNNLATTDVTLTTTSGNYTGTPGSAGYSQADGPNGEGDIFVNSPISWTSSHTLTLSAWNNIYVDASITATAGKVSLIYGTNGSTTADYFISAPINLSAGQNFTTKLGSNAAVSYTVITSLGSVSDILGGTTAPSTPTAVTSLQGIDGNDAVLAGHYALGANIDASATASFNSSGSSTANAGGQGFDPIANANVNGTIYFAGTFAGLGHTISNLHINESGNNTADGFSGTGLFAQVQGPAIVRDVGLVNPTIVGCSACATTNGQQEAGALIGATNNNNGTGAVTILNTYVSGGSVTGTSAIGGLIGFVQASSSAVTIDRSYSTASVSGSYQVGGLIGYFGAGGSVTNSYATGAVSASSVVGTTNAAAVGGLVGDVESQTTIANSFAAGTVSGANGGALLGFNNGAISNSYWDTTVTGALAAIGGGSLGGSGSTTNVSGQTTAALQPSTTAAFLAGFASPPWYASPGNFPSFIQPTTFSQVAITTVTITGGGTATATYGTSFAVPTGNAAGATGYYTITGLPNGDTLSSLTLALTGSGVSGNATAATTAAGTSLTITPSGATSSDPNLTFVYNAGVLTLGKLPVTLSGSQVYNGGTSFSSSGLTLTNGVAGATASSIGLTGSGSVGSKNVSAGNQALNLTGLSLTDSNYIIVGGSGTASFTRLALTGSISTGSSTYGSALSPGTATFTNAVAGDNLGTVTVAVNTTGLVSGSGHLIAGSHTGIESVSALSGADAGNYTFAALAGDYTVSKLALASSISTGSSVYGSALSPGTLTFTNAISGDLVTAGTVTVNTAGLLSGGGNLTAGSHSGIETVGGTLGGADSGNYSFAGATGNYTVSKLSLIGSISTGSSIYGATLSPGTAGFTNAIGGDDLGTATVVVNTTGLLSTSGNLTAGVHTGIQSVNALSGADAGNYNFAAVTGDYSVSKLALAGSITTGSSIYGSALSPGAATFTNAIAGDSVIPGTVTVNTAGLLSSSGNLIAGSHTGIQSVNTLNGVDAGNYSFAGITGDYTVSKLALTASISTGSSTYGSALSPGTVTFTNAVGGDLVGAGTVTMNTAGLLSSSGNLIAGSHSGIQSVGGTLGGADSGNYSFAGATGDYAVSKLALTASISTGSSTYGSALSPGTVTFTNAAGGDLVTAGTVTVNTTGLVSSSGNLTAGFHTGIQSVGGTLGGADSGNYSFAGATGNYTVSKLALTGSITTGSSVYGSALSPGTAAFTNAISGDSLGTATVTVNTTGLLSSSSNLTAGSHTGIEFVTALSGTDVGNYSFAAVTGNYTVSKLALTASISTGSSTYGSALSPGTVTFTNAVGGDLVTAGTVTVNTAGLLSSSGNLIAGSHSGIESVGGTLGGADSGNYSFAGATGNYTVSKLALTGSISTGTSTYGSALSPGTVTFTNAIGGDLVTPGAVTVNTAGLLSSSSNLTAGSHTGIESVSALSGSDAGNYSFAAVTGNYTVSKLALAGSISTGASIYGSALSPGAATFSNAVGGDSLGNATVTVNSAGLVSSSGNLIAGSHTGIETVSALSGADAGNYSFAAVTGNYSVSKLALAGSIATGSSIYGSALSPGPVTFTNAVAGDLVTAGTVTLNTAGLLSSSGHLNAGSHTGIETVGGTLGGADSGNYSFAGATGDYTVSTRPLTITADNQTRLNGNPNPPLTYQIGGLGLASGDSLTGILSTTAASSSPIGIYPISRGSLAATSNYSLTYIPGILTVNALAPAANATAPSSQASASIVNASYNAIFGDPGSLFPLLILPGGVGGTNGAGVIQNLGNPAFDFAMVCWNEHCVLVDVPGARP